ncbi:MAG: hypothetical protein AB2421_06540 [Thermotaleaceae bacterium]
MNQKKSLIVFLLSIFLLIIVYNFFVPYLRIDTSTGIQMGMGMGMGRGMHGGEGISSNTIVYYNLIPYIIIILSIFLILFIVVKLFFYSNNRKCIKCGLYIESDDWKICPICGHPLQEKGGSKS